MCSLSKRFKKRFKKIIPSVDSDECKRDEAIFVELVREYEWEYHRSEALEQKAMHIGTSGGTLLTFFLGFVLVNIERIMEMSFVSLLANFVCLQIIFYFLVSTVRYSLNAIELKEYSTLEPEKIVELYGEKNYNHYLTKYRDDIITSIKENRQNGNDKARKYNESLKTMLYSIIALVLYFFFNYFYVVSLM